MAIQRNTLQRTLILEAVGALKNHPTSDMICDYVRSQNPAVSRSTVYRNLNLLCDEGLLLRVQTPGAADHFDHNCDSHHHVICEVCGNVYDVTVRSSYLPDDTSVLCNGVFCEECGITSCALIFTGVCKNCR